MANEKVSLYALSIKQPWAALIVAGVKTIEIRRWPTARRGRVIIHAARIPDKRPEGHRLVPRELDSLAQLCGGVVGMADLTDCRHYADLTHFQADQSLHCNEPTWFEKKGLYGFVFANPQRLPFRSLSGWVRFFRVDVPEASEQMVLAQELPTWTVREVRGLVDQESGVRSQTETSAERQDQ